MADFIEFDVDVDGKALQKKADNLVDDKTMQQILNLYAMLLNPFVPAQENILASGAKPVKIGNEWYLVYSEPYAHYQYVGEVYGPNFPGWEDGATEGWRSPSGKGSKHPTGRKLGEEGHATLTPKWELNADGTYSKADPTKLIEWDFGYTKQPHPKATSEWDKKAMENSGIKQQFLEGVKNILAKRARELYG